MARTLDQVLAEITPQFTASENILNARLGAIPGETESGIAAADAKLGQANENILSGARRRGIGFSGIPIGEQAKYAATDYAPAVANLKSAGLNKELTLQEQLATLGREKRTQAQSIFDTEQSRDFQERQFQESIRQFNEQQAAAARAAAGAGGGYSFGGGDIGDTRPPLDTYEGVPSVKVNGSSYAFYDANGKGISAIQYALQTGYGVKKLLSEMAAKGDKGAAIANKYVGNDGKFGKPASGNDAAALRSIGAQGNYINNSTVKATNYGSSVADRTGVTNTSASQQERLRVAAGLGVAVNSPLVDRYIASGKK